MIARQQPSSATGVLHRVYRPEGAMSLLGMTTAIILVASSGTTSLGTNPTTDAARIATNAGMRIYRRNHIQRLVQMVAKAVGAAPHGRWTRIAGALLWRTLRLRAGVAPAKALPA